MGRLQRLRGLVVEREGESLTRLTEILGRWGIDVTCATDSKAALEEVRLALRHGHGFQLFILNADLPGPAASRSVEALRSEYSARKHRFPGALLLSRTGEARGAVMRRDLYVLRTPVSPYDLLCGVARLLSPSRFHMPAANDHAGPPTASRTILVVDDVESHRRFASAILRRHGYTVVTAESGEQALKAARQGGMDVALIDLRMPGMSGIETAAALRADDHARNRHTALIGMSSDTSPAVREQCLAVGMDAFLFKPLDTRGLLNQVRRVTMTLGDEAAAARSSMSEVHREFK